jgi:hypothetical protein
MPCVNSLNAEFKPICHLLALLGDHHILHVSRVRVKLNLGFLGFYAALNGSLVNDILELICPTPNFETQ